MERIVIKILLGMVVVICVSGMAVCGVAMTATVVFVLFDVMTAVIRHTHGNAVAIGVMAAESCSTIKMFAPHISIFLLEGCLFLVLLTIALRNQTKEGQ